MTARGPTRVARALAGRTRELEELTDALTDAVDGAGDVIVVSGPAGIGKTRLGEELAARAGDLGMRTAWGRCSEDPGTPPFWPWTQILRNLPDGGDQLRSLLEERVTRPEEEGPARFELFASVTATLREAARAGPLLLLLDDVQFAGGASIGLLRFVAQDLHDARVVLVLLVRDDETTDPKLAEWTRSLGRLGRTVPLRGLSRSELSALVRDGFGFEPPDDVMRSLWRLTEGNPFFAIEIVRLFLAERHAGSRGDDLPLPDGVLDIVRRRLEPLGPDARSTLTLASVIGRQFDLEILTRASGRDHAEIDTDVDELLEHKVIEPDATGTGFAFSHALVHQAMYETLKPHDRIAAHRAIADAVQQLPSSDRRSSLLAHHTYEARSLLGDAAVIPHLVRSAENALSRFAYEEAIRQYRLAIELLDEHADPTDHARLLIALGESYRRAGIFGDAMHAFASAAAAARSASARDDFVRAAVRHEDARSEAGGFTHVPMSMSLLAEALELLGDDDDILRAEVLSRRPLVLHFVGATELMLDPAREAVAVAERSGDRRLLLRTLEGLRAAYWSAEDAEQRLRTSERYLDVARSADRKEAIARGEIWRFIDLLTLGRGADLDAQILTVSTAVRASRRPSLSWWPEAMHATRALMRGDLAGAREHTDLVSAAAHPDDVFASGAAALSTIGRAWEENDRDELGAAIGTMSELLPVPAARSTLNAFAATLNDDPDRARKAFEEVAAGRFAALLKGSAQLPVVALLAFVCGRLGDAERAETLYALIPHEPPIVVVVPPIAALFTTPHWLGVLAAAAGRLDDADRHFETARALHERLGAPAWVARTLVEHGTALAGSTSRRGQGLLLLREAHRLSSALGLHTLDERAARSLDSLDDRSDEQDVFLREGDVWRLSFEGREARIADLKGLAFLRVLLSQPGEEVHVLRLITLAEHGSVGTGGLHPASELNSDAASSPEAIDEAAVRAYRARIDELRGEIEDANALGDDARASQAKTEADRIAEELGRSLGLGGRHRRPGTPAERARVNVQRAIRTAIDRIAAVHPDLARHLTDHVRTGTSCVYLRPDRTARAWLV